MRLGLTIDEIYDGCGVLLPIRRQKVAVLPYLPLSLLLTHLRTAIYRYLACIPRFWLVCWWPSCLHFYDFVLFVLWRATVASDTLPLSPCISSSHPSLVLHRIQSSRWRLQLVPCFYMLLVVDVYAAFVVRIRRTSTPSSHTFLLIAFS